MKCPRSSRRPGSRRSTPGRTATSPACTSRTWRRTSSPAPRRAACCSPCRPTRTSSRPPTSSTRGWSCSVTANARRTTSSSSPSGRASPLFSTGDDTWTYAVKLFDLGMRWTGGSGGRPNPGRRRPLRGVRAATARSDLVPALQRAQAALGLSAARRVRRIADDLRLTESEVFGVATFYAQFRFTPPGRHRLRVCLGTACHVKGGVQMMETLERRLGWRRRDDARRRVRPGAGGLSRLLCPRARVHAGRDHLRPDERPQAAGGPGCPRRARLSAGAASPGGAGAP